MPKATIFTKPYRIQAGNWGDSTEKVEGITSVIQLESPDFAMIDNVDSLREWASPANQASYQLGRAKDIKNTGYEAAYWGGIKSHKDLMRMMNEGWHEGAALMRDLSAQIFGLIPVPVGNRRTLRWADQGDEVDMARVYSGQLDTAWRAMPRSRQRAPRVVSIDANVGANCNVSAESLKWAGVAAVALTDALESAGYRVELYSTAASYIRRYESNKPPSVVLSRMIAKRATEPLNPQLVASMVAHPAAFRWYHLQSWLHHPDGIGMGYGCAAQIETPLEMAVREGILEGAEVVLKDSLSQEAAIKEVSRAIAKLEADQLAGRGSMK